MTPEHLAKAEQDARRFSGCWWQGTSGTLAAWVILLLKERKTMATTLEQSNAALRQAVEARIAGTPIDLPEALAGYTLTPAEPAEEATFDDPEPVVQMTPEQLDAAWAGVAERQRQMQAAIREPQAAEPVTRRVVPTPMPPADRQDEQTALRPGSREFVAVLEELKALHLAKTLDYGVDDDALANIRQSAAVVGMPPWSGAILRIADKMHRLKAFHARGECRFDGVDDTLKDIACYAAIALVLYREATCTKVQ